MPTPRLLLSLVTCVTAVMLAGCAGSSGVNSPTAAAQRRRAEALATQIARKWDGTRQAQSAQATHAVRASADRIQGRLSWPVLFEDAFDDNAANWPEGEADDPLASLQRAVEVGVYRWQAQAKDSFAWWVYPEAPAASDIYLAADVRLLGSAPDTAAGLIFRASEDDDYYLYEVNQRGEYAIYLHQAGEWQTLEGWSPLPDPAAGDRLRLAVLAEGSRLTFFLNDAYLTSLSDESLASGWCGLLIELANPGDEGAWEFDNFELRDLGQEVTRLSPGQS